MSSAPLVSIGIPTYNRSGLLRRAIESALAQDYPNVEVVVSDNASTDDTPAVCAEFVARDPRVRYVRLEVNRGATHNFRNAFEQTRGELFAWLGDDDHFDPSYVRECSQILVDHPDYAVVSGLTRYYSDGQFRYQEIPINAVESTGPERVCSFFRQVVHCGIFYGVIRRRCLEQAIIRQTIGFDWLVVAALMQCGGGVTTDRTTLHRALGGATKDLGSIAESLKVPRLFVRSIVTNYAVLAVAAYQQIGWTCPAFAAVGFVRRQSLAVRVSSIVVQRYVAPNIHFRGKGVLLRILWGPRPAKVGHS